MLEINIVMHKKDLSYKIASFIHNASENLSYTYALNHKICHTIFILTIVRSYLYRYKIFISHVLKWKWQQQFDVVTKIAFDVNRFFHFMFAKLITKFCLSIKCICFALNAISTSVDMESFFVNFDNVFLNN